MLRKIIRGQLSATNPKNDETNWNWTRLMGGHISYNRYLRQLINYDREWYGADSVWSVQGYKVDKENSAVLFNSPSPIWEGREDFIKFVTALKELLTTDAAIALGLEGSFEIVMETPRLPLVFRVDVKDGVVTYREAEHITWSETITA